MIYSDELCRLIKCVILKEIREHQRHKSLVLMLIMVGVMWLVNLFIVSRTLNSMLDMGALRIYLNSMCTHQAVSFFMIITFMLLPSLYSRERNTGSLESLMVTPMPLVVVWLAKTLFITIIGVLFCWTAVAFGYGAIHLLIKPDNGLMLPDMPAILFLLLVFPTIAGLMSGMMGLVQLIMPNPGVGLMIYLWIGIGYLAITTSQMRALTVTWRGLVPYMLFDAILAFAIFWLHKLLTRERVLMSGH